MGLSVGGGNLVALFDASDTPIVELTKITNVTGSGGFEGRFAFTATQIDQSTRALLKPYWIKLQQTDAIEALLEDGSTEEIYPGETAARENSNAKLLKYIHYGPVDTATNKRLVNYGLCYLSGESDAINTTGNTINETAYIFNPVTVVTGDAGTIDTFPIASFDTGKVAAPIADKTVSAGDASVEEEMDVS